MKPEERFPVRQTLLVLIVLAIGIAYLWGVNAAQEIAPRATRFGKLGSWDLETYFLPKFVYGTQEILAGRLPVWNPFEFGGIPFLATAQPAALYLPKVLIFALFEPATAMKVFFLAHTMLAGIAFLLFAREERMGLLGAMAGVLCFAFSRKLLSSTGHPVIMSNLVWIPLLFLLSERIALRATAVSIVGLALVVGLQLTAGYPQVTLDSALLLALYATARYATGEWKKPPWQTLPFLALSFTIGATIAAVQLLPLVDLLRVTGRVGLAERIVATAAPLPGLAMWLLLAANGVPGLVVFALAGANRRSITPCAGFLLCAFFIIGGFRLLRMIPGFGAVRMAGTWFLPAQFFAAWLVACGVDRVARAGLPLARWRRAALVMGGGGWAGVCLLARLRPEVFSIQASRWLGLAPAGLGLAASALGAIGALAFVAFGLTSRRASAAPALALVGILLVALGHLCAVPLGHALATLRVPDHPYRSSTLITDPTLREGRVFSVVDTRGGFHLLDRVENPFGREGSLPPPRFTALEKRLGVVVQMVKVAWNELSGRQGLLDTLDLRYLVVPRHWLGELRGIDYEETGDGDSFAAVLRARHPLGRAWAVYGVRVTDSSDQALAALMSTAFDARHQVILERPPRGWYPDRATRSPTPGRVRRVSPTLTEVEIDMAQPGVLVLADSCFPGWTVDVDGQPGVLQCANYLVRAVELDAGPHHVSFRYSSRWVSWGSVLSLVGLVAVGLILAGEFWRRSVAGFR